MRQLGLDIDHQALLRKGLAFVSGSTFRGFHKYRPVELIEDTQIFNPWPSVPTNHGGLSVSTLYIKI